jgi:hypothetical protein
MNQNFEDNQNQMHVRESLHGGVGCPLDNQGVVLMKQQVSTDW